jgi:hypothetical protein
VCVSVCVCVCVCVLCLCVFVRVSVGVCACQFLEVNQNASLEFVKFNLYLPSKSHFVFNSSLLLVCLFVDSIIT